MESSSKKNGGEFTETPEYLLRQALTVAAVNLMGAAQEANHAEEKGDPIPVARIIRQLNAAKTWIGKAETNLDLIQ